MIVDKCKVEIPQCMIETQIDNYIREFQYSLTYQGLKIEDYLKYTNTTMEALRDNYREKSAQAVKHGFEVTFIIPRLFVPVCLFGRIKL